MDGADAETIFKILLDDEMRDVFFFQQISHEKEKMIFKLPWGGAILRNCFSNGKLLEFRTFKEYEVYKKERHQQLWLLLPLKVFRHSNTLFGVYCCPQCESMAGTDNLSVDQDPAQIATRICVHSKVCSTLLGDWRTIWDINVSPLTKVVKIVCNENITMHTFQVSTKESTLLAAIREQSKVALLYTVTYRQDSPLCSVCTTRKCKHAHIYSKQMDKEEDEPEFVSAVNTVEEPMVEDLPMVEVLPMVEDLPVQPDNSSDDNTSETGSVEESESGQAEHGKHKNYWVSLKVLF